MNAPLTAGQTIQQTYNPSITEQYGTAYCGNFEYTTENGDEALTTLKRVYNAEGYMQDGQWHYYRRDHLGNNREVWCANTNSTVQRTQYYPSGLPFASNTDDNPSTQNRKYNGKEFVEMHGFDEYDYGARGMFPALMRFSQVDPLAEKYYSTSPYAYCLNNPVRFIDPDGMSSYSINPDGEINMTNPTDDKFDMLNVVDAKGNQIEGVDALKVNDQSILEDLSKSRDKSDYNGSYSITSSSEVGKVFTYASNNSNVEWGLSYFRGSESNQFVISTSHKNGYVTSATSIDGFNEESMIFNIHSHQGNPQTGFEGTKGASSTESGGQRSDMNIIIDMAYRFNSKGNYTTSKFPLHYVYHKNSKGLYQYTPYEKSLYLGKVNNANLFKVLQKTHHSQYKK